MLSLTPTLSMDSRLRGNDGFSANWVSDASVTHPRFS
jgi:hypothetical protein